VQLVPLAGTNDNVPLLSSDQLDVGGALVGAGVFNAVARGVGIRMVADRGSTIPGRTTSSLALRTDVLEQMPWTGYGDLRGLKLAHAQPGSQTEYWVERMLDRGGLQREDLEIIAPLTFQDTALAFANKAIDAAIDNEPWATQQELQGSIKKVAYMDDVAPGMPTATVLYSETFARNTPAARNYLVGWLRGVRAYWDAYDGRRDFAALVAVLQKYTALKDETLIRKVPPTGQNPAGYLDPVTLATLQDWFAEKGLVPRKADVAQVYDPSFADYANAVLGPYQRVENPRRPE
jgi:NitT/TauT family transport system substrate-binding protein